MAHKLDLEPISEDEETKQITSKPTNYDSSFLQWDHLITNDYDILRKRRRSESPDLRYDYEFNDNSPADDYDTTRKRRRSESPDLQYDYEIICMGELNPKYKTDVLEILTAQYDLMPDDMKPSDDKIHGDDLTPSVLPQDYREFHQHSKTKTKTKRRYRFVDKNIIDYANSIHKTFSDDDVKILLAMPKDLSEEQNKKRRSLLYLYNQYRNIYEQKQFKK